jgi:hypothetical protein
MENCSNWYCYNQRVDYTYIFIQCKVIIEPPIATMHTLISIITSRLQRKEIKTLGVFT